MRRLGGVYFVLSCKSKLKAVPMDNVFYPSSYHAHSHVCLVGLSMAVKNIDTIVGSGLG